MYFVTLSNHKTWLQACLSDLRVMSVHREKTAKTRKVSLIALVKITDYCSTCF